MKSHDLTYQGLLGAIDSLKKTSVSRDPSINNPTYKRALDSFEERMAYAPRHKFFASEEEQRRSMEKRIAFLKVLDKHARASGKFMLTDEFIQDFIERND